MPHYSFDLLNDIRYRFRETGLLTGDIAVYRNGHAFASARITRVGRVMVELPEEVISRLDTGRSNIIARFRDYQGAKELDGLEIIDME